MPRRIPSMASNRYGDAWRKIRKATLRGQPLCALCLMGGKINPAVIVDHKVPLEDGGTNAQDNLQPLCKRCHDAIKTPADILERKNRQNAGIILHVAWIGSADSAAGIDLRIMRRHLGQIYGWAIGHDLMNAAALGMAGMQMIEQAKQSIVIIIDDYQQAKMIKARTGVRLAIEEEGQAPKIGDTGEAIFMAS